MERVNIDKELIIIDSFFFSKPKNSNYVAILDQILDKFISTIDDLIIITNTYRIDTTVKNSIINTLRSKKPSINIIHKSHDDYHDRYWISGARERGIVIGTSLNSIGNKVALIDRLNTTDVRGIIKELTSDGLI